MYLMTECDDRMGKYLPLRTSCASVIFYRHGPREKYCTFLARLNDLAKSYLTIRPLSFFFFSLFFSFFAHSQGCLVLAPLRTGIFFLLSGIL